MLLTLDFETYFDVRCSLGKMTTMEYINDSDFKVHGASLKFDDEPAEWYPHEELTEALAQVDWDDTQLLCHNASFDGAVLASVYGYVPQYYLDTSAMARGLYPGQSSSLANTAIRMFPDDEAMRKGNDLGKSKGLHDLPPEIEEALANYCIQDSELTHAIWVKFKDQLPSSELDLIDITTRMFTMPKMVLDRERLTAYMDTERLTAEKLIDDSGVEPEVLRSNPKFATYIQEQLDLIVPTKKSPTTGEFIPALGKNDAGFQQLCAMYPEHQKVWDARVAAKSRLAETRSQRFLNAANPDNTIGIPLRYYAAHTGRFGGSDKLNFQNMPRGSELRKCLTAPKDHLIYVADLSNIEARMLAWLAEQADLLDQFRDGEDVYSSFASTIYDRQIRKDNDPTERFVGKTAVLGLGYGMGWKKFQSTLALGAAGPVVEVDDEKSWSIVNAYRSKFYRIPHLWKLCDSFLIDMLTGRSNYHKVVETERNRIRLPNGMSLYYENLQRSEQGFEFQSNRKQVYTYGGKITENIVQALSRIVVTDALIRIAYKRKDLHVCLTVHDEIVCVGPAEAADERMQDIIDLMCIPPSWAEDLPLAAEGGYDSGYSK
jgi:DNA polymerase